MAQGNSSADTGNKDDEKYREDYKDIPKGMERRWKPLIDSGMSIEWKMLPTDREHSSGIRVSPRDWFGTEDTGNDEQDELISLEDALSRIGNVKTFMEGMRKRVDARYNKVAERKKNEEMEELVEHFLNTKAFMEDMRIIVLQEDWKTPEETADLLNRLFQLSEYLGSVRKSLEELWIEHKGYVCDSCRKKREEEQQISDGGSKQNENVDSDVKTE